MIFRIGEKFYIKVQGYYKEVDISIEGDNLEIKPNGNEIEASNIKNVQSYDAVYEKDIIKKYLVQPKKVEHEYVQKTNRKTSRM